MRFNRAVVAASFVFVAAVSHSAVNVVSIGRTYPIDELDALSEVEEHAKRADVNSLIREKSESLWSALNSLDLPPAPETLVRRVKPYYTLQMDIPDASGRVIYPKGYRFNPLEFVTMPNRVIVISEDDVAWAKSVISPSSVIILTKGDRVRVSRELDHVVFLLDRPTRDRLSLRYVPSIVEQIKDELQISETHLGK